MDSNIDSHLKKLNKKLAVIQRDMKVHQSFEKNQSRKRRTKRLIQIGALTQKYFDLYNLDVNEVEEVLSQFSGFVKANKLEKHKQKNSNPDN